MPALRKEFVAELKSLVMTAKNVLSTSVKRASARRLMTTTTRRQLNLLLLIPILPKAYGA